MAGTSLRREEIHAFQCLVSDFPVSCTTVHVFTWFIQEIIINPSHTLDVALYLCHNLCHLQNDFNMLSYVIFPRSLYKVTGQRFLLIMPTS